MQFLAKRFLTAAFSGALFVLVVSSASGGSSTSPASQPRLIPATVVVDGQATPKCEFAHAPSEATHR